MQIASWSNIVKEFLKFPLNFGVKTHKTTKTFGEASNMFRIFCMIVTCTYDRYLGLKFSEYKQSIKWPKTLFFPFNLFGYKTLTHFGYKCD